MKSLKKMMALALAMVMVLAMGITVFAEPYGEQDQAHTITITTHGNGTHNYTAYQVFKGNLNAAEGILSDIDWGTGVNGANLLAALKADETIGTSFTSATTAADVAKVLEANKNTASFVEAFADLVSKNLGTVAGTGATTNKVAKINVTGDGYYFIKDTTATLAEGDTASKFILEVVKNVEINAKDTLLAPDKKILKANGENFDRVKENTAAVGDTVTFEVTIPVPDTTAYKDHFVFNMQDTLPAGLTFTGISSIKIDKNTLTEGAATAAGGTYTTTAKTGTADFAAYTVPSDPVTAEGGQTIKVVFHNFKAYVEADQDSSTEGVQNLIGKNVVITYTAVVNDDAVYGSTGNENEVEFIYSNDPNHDYTGDEPSSTDPTGETPKSNTKTFVAGIEILKVDGSNSNNPLANAEFEISSESYNKTVTKGVKYEKAPYTAQTGETVESGDYWKLKDGSYTSTSPTTANMNTTQYDNVDEKYVKVTWSKIVVEPGTAKKVTFITGSDGIIDVKGLKPGTYTIKETHAPDGYNKINDEIKIVIDWDASTTGDNATAATFKLGQGTTEGVQLVADGTGANASANAIYKIQVVNNKGAELPSTGGIGTTIFYIVGAILVLGAGILLVTRRRMNAN